MGVGVVMAPRTCPNPSMLTKPPPAHRTAIIISMIALPSARVDPQDDDIPGEVRFLTYEVLKAETANPRLRWAYLPYSMHMAGPREAIQHMIIRKNYGARRRASRLLADRILTILQIRLGLMT